MRQRNNFDDFPKLPPMPLFFKLWFAFIFTMILLVWGLTAFLGYTAIHDPKGVGEFVGTMASGYQHAAGN